MAKHSKRGIFGGLRLFGASGGAHRRVGATRTPSFGSLSGGREHAGARTTLHSRAPGRGWQPNPITLGNGAYRFGR